MQGEHGQGGHKRGGYSRGGQGGWWKGQGRGQGKY